MLASQAEIGVWVQAPGRWPGCKGITREKNYDIVYKKNLQTGEFFWRS